MKKIDRLQPPTAPHHNCGSQRSYRPVTSPANTPACNRLKRQRLNKHDSWKQNRILLSVGWMSCDSEAACVILAEGSGAHQQVQAAASTVPGWGETKSSRDSTASLNLVRIFHSLSSRWTSKVKAAHTGSTLQIHSYSCYFSRVLSQQVWSQKLFLQLKS